MAEQELVKMSPKGQLVIPQELRKIEGFKTGDRFVPFLVEDGVLFKRVKIPDVRVEFGALAKEIKAQFKKQKISSKDVSEAVKWARR